MVFDILNRLRQGGKLYSCSITVFQPGAINDRGSVFGREIIDFNKSGIRFRGGETGYEEFTVSLENVLEIESGGNIIFKKKPRIKRVYPR